MYIYNLYICFIVYMYICIFVILCLSMYIYVYRCIHIYIYICMYVCMCVYTHNIHIYIYIYIYAHLKNVCEWLQPSLGSMPFIRLCGIGQPAAIGDPLLLRGLSQTWKRLLRLHLRSWWSQPRHLRQVLILRSCQGNLSRPSRLGSCLSLVIFSVNVVTQRRTGEFLFGSCISV